MRGKREKGRRKKAKPYITPEDFRYPGEKMLYWQGVGGVMVLFVWIAAMFFFFAKTAAGTPRYDLVAEALVYPAVAVFLCNILSTRPRMREFKRRGPQSKVQSTNYPELFRILGEFQKLCGRRRPFEMHIVDDENAYIFTLPHRGGTIVASTGLVRQLKTPELAALVAHEIGHILARHVRMELAIVYIRGANPIWKLVLLPVTLMSVLMRGWLDVIDYSADRCAVLLTGGNAGLVNVAIVKHALAMESEPEITMEELEAFLASPKTDEVDQTLLDRQIRARRFIDKVPNLRDRIEVLAEFPKSEQGQAAIAKVRRLIGAA